MSIHQLGIRFGYGTTQTSYKGDRIMSWERVVSHYASPTIKATWFRHQNNNNGCIFVLTAKLQNIPKTPWYEVWRNNFSVNLSNKSEVKELVFKHLTTILKDVISHQTTQNEMKEKLHISYHIISNYTNQIEKVWIKEISAWWLCIKKYICDIA